MLRYFVWLRKPSNGRVKNGVSGSNLYVDQGSRVLLERKWVEIGFTEISLRYYYLLLGIFEFVTYYLLLYPFSSLNLSPYFPICKSILIHNSLEGEKFYLRSKTARGVHCETHCFINWKTVHFFHYLPRGLFLSQLPMVHFVLLSPSSLSTPCISLAV